MSAALAQPQVDGVFTREQDHPPPLSNEQNVLAFPRRFKIAPVHADTYPDKTNRVRLRAMVLVMRYTGLRIRDVVTLRKDHIKDGKLFLRTAKTGTDVFCPLPREAVEALKAIKADGEYYFWSGTSKPRTAVGVYQQALRTLFDNAQAPRVHAHLFRHTFATELLTAGNSLETVAALLGHSSTKVTERSYSHWVKGRQERLEEAVKNSWAQLGTVESSA